MAGSTRARNDAGEALVTAALLGLSLTANLWVFLYFKRNSKPSPTPAAPEEQQQQKTEEDKNAATAVPTGPTIENEKKKSSAPPAAITTETPASQPQKDKPPTQRTKQQPKQQPSDSGSSEDVDIAMTLFGAFSAFSTLLLTVLVWASQKRAFPKTADGLVLSSLLGLLTFALASMARRWTNFFDWVFCAYAAAILGYVVEVRFRYCNQLIDSMGGV